MEELAAKGKLVRPSDGKEVNTVAFVEMVDDQIAHPWLYNSAVGSLVALKQAHYLRKTNPNGKAFIFYENMRAPGQYEKFYRSLQDDPGVFMSKGSPVSITNGSSGLTVQMKDTLLGEDLKVKADLVVLSTGMVPVTKDSAVLNLKYRQGPFLPREPLRLQ